MYQPTADVLVLDEAPGHLLRLAQQRHTLTWTQEFDTGLTGPQFAVLVAVGLGGDPSQGIVGERASLDTSSVTDIVGRLESQGWLRLTRDPGDLRRKRVELTAPARQALPDLTRRVAAVSQRFLAPVPEADRDAFLALLRRVAGTGDLHPAAAPSARPLREVPGHLLRRAQQVHTAAWAAEVGPSLTAPQYSVLATLWPHADGIDQTSAGRSAGLDKSSMADVVGRLHRRELIERTRDPRDARYRSLRLTARARRELPAISAAVRGVQERLLAPLVDDRERSDFLHGCRALGDPGTCTEQPTPLRAD